MSTPYVGSYVESGQWHVLKKDWYVEPGVDMGWTKKGWRVNCGQQQLSGQALIICGQWPVVVEEIDAGQC